MHLAVCVITTRKQIQSGTVEVGRENTLKTIWTFSIQSSDFIYPGKASSLHWPMIYTSNQDSKLVNLQDVSHTSIFWPNSEETTPLIFLYTKMNVKTTPQTPWAMLQVHNRDFVKPQMALSPLKLCLKDFFVLFWYILGVFCDLICCIVIWLEIVDSCPQDPVVMKFNCAPSSPCAFSCDSTDERKETWPSSAFSSISASLLPVPLCLEVHTDAHGSPLEAKSLPALQ